MQGINAFAQHQLPNAIVQDNNTNWSDLHDAAANGDEKRLQGLLASTVDRMCKERKHGNTPLHEAATRGYSRCVKLLCTPPQPDTKAKKLKKTVLETRANSLLCSILGIRNDEGFSALHLAAQNGHNQSCRELLLAGTDPDVQNFYGDTALHTACRYGHAGATRIILSAQCDANKANLNGDTALHISCAMGRRKLTRILLEAGCNVQLTNAQGETPRDIATRKRYKEILEILDNPRPNRGRKKKPREKDANATDGAGRNVSPLKEINWSPYGCHYYPDPRAFPHPKLETLPKEPLKPGEQYYLDLAGQIHKGPVGVGNTCYCGTFFRHIEDKINCNRRSLIKYVHKAKESMGQKVQALAIRTNDQIEQLTRTMIEERARCESRRIYIDRCLRRGEPIRLTADYQLKSKRRQAPDEGTLVRCRSMDFLDENQTPPRHMKPSRSCDLLDDAIVQVHQADDHSEHGTFNDEEESSTTDLSIGKLCKGIDEPDMERLTKRLGELLAKTKLLADMSLNSEQEANVDGPNVDDNGDDDDDDDNEDDKTDSESSVVDSPTAFNRSYNNNNTTAIPKTSLNEGGAAGDSADTLRNENTITDLDQGAADIAYRQSYKPIYSAVNHIFQRRQLSSALSQTSNQSQQSAQQEQLSSLDSPLPQQYFSNEHNLQHVIKALSKDHLNQSVYAEQDCLNQNEPISEDKLSYKGEQINELLQSSNSNSLQQTQEHLPQTVRGITANIERNLHSSTTEAIVHSSHQEQSNTAALRSITQNPSSVNPGRVEKLEIKNCEIKSLKKTSAASNFKTKVQNLVERFQSSTSGQRASKQSTTQVAVSQAAANVVDEKYDSESSEDDQNNHNERLSHTQYKQVLQQQLQQQHQQHLQTQRTYHNAPAMASNQALPRNLPYLPARTLISLNAKSVNTPALSHLNTPQQIPTLQTVHPAYVQQQQQASPQASAMHYAAQRLPQNQQYYTNAERVVPKDAYFHKLPNKTKTTFGTAVAGLSGVSNFYNHNNNNNYQNADSLQQMNSPTSSTIHNSSMANANYQSAYLSAQQYRQAQLENLQHSPNLQLSPGSGSSYASMSEHIMVNRVGLPPTPIESALYRQLPPVTNAVYKQYPTQPQLEQITSLPSNISPTLQSAHAVERDMLSNDSGFSTRIYYEA